MVTLTRQGRTPSRATGHCFRSPPSTLSEPTQLIIPLTHEPLRLRPPSACGVINAVPKLRTRTTGFRPDEINAAIKAHRCRYIYSCVFAEAQTTFLSLLDTLKPIPVSP